MSGDDKRQPGPILGQIPHLPRPASLPAADGDAKAEIERLRAEVGRLRDEIATLAEQNGELATNYVRLLDLFAAERAEVGRLTDELQQVANEIALAESQEARRER